MATKDKQAVLPDPQLSPPLRLRWQLQRGTHAASAVGDLTYVTLQNFGIAAVGPDGKVAWSRPGDVNFWGPQLLPDSTLLVSELASRKRWQRALDPRTGKELWSEPVGDIGFGTVVDETSCTAFSADHRTGRARLMLTTLPPSPKALWEREFVRAGGGPGLAFDPRGVVAGESIVVLDTQRDDRMFLLALALRTGEEKWHLDLHKHGVKTNKYTRYWHGDVRGNKLLFRLENDLVCVDLEEGVLVWKTAVRGVTGPTGVGGHRVVGVNGATVSVLDLATGKILKKKDLSKVLRARHRANHLTSHPLISDTHIFVGDMLGALWALDVNTCEPVWDDRPEGTIGNLRGASLVNGRLYIGDYTEEPRVARHLYCWEPVGPGEAAPKSPLPKFESEGDLPFEIEEFAPRRKLTKRAPYHEAGGPWTVYRCWLEGGDVGTAGFCFADRVSGKVSPIRGAEAALWVESAAEGEALLRAFKESMPHRKAKTGRAQRVKAPTVLKAIDLGSQGSQQRRKWVAEPEACELLVEWDTKTKEGCIHEKDPDQRLAVLELIAGLVVRSARV